MPIGVRNKGIFTVIYKPASGYTAAVRKHMQNTHAIQDDMCSKQAAEQGPDSKTHQKLNVTVHHSYPI